MLDKYKDFLSQAYNKYITTGDRHSSIQFKSAKEKKIFLTDAIIWKNVAT